MFYFVATFTCLSMILTGFSLLTTIVILSLHHHSSNRRVPAVIRNIVIQKLGTLLRLTPNTTGKVAPAVDNETIFEATSDGADNQVKQFELAAVDPLILKLCIVLLRKEADVEKRDDIESEWKLVAAIIDRLFFMIASAILVVASLVIVIIYSSGDT